MVALRLPEHESIDTLIVAARRLLHQLEEVKSAKVRYERAPGRPRPKCASSTRPVSIPDLQATLEAIVGEAQAQIAKLGQLEAYDSEEHQLETHERETHEQETHEQETQEQEASVPSSQEHVDQILTRRRLPERRTGCSNLGFSCSLSQLGENMVATIQQARNALGCNNVDERGYLVLRVQERWVQPYAERYYN